MQLQTNVLYSDIAEVKEVRVAECNRLLQEGWILLGIYPFTTVANMNQNHLQPQPAEEESRRRRQPEPTQYVRRLVVYIVGRKP